MSEKTEELLSKITAGLFVASIIMIFINPAIATVTAILFVGTNLELALHNHRKDK